MPHFHREQLFSLIGILAGLTLLSGFYYWVSPGMMKAKNWPTIITEVLFFVFIFFWNVIILAHGKSSKTLCAGGEISLMADRLKVRRIVQNLLDNAIKYCAPNGKVTLDASATPSEVTIRVIDEGPGIPQEEMRQISQGAARTFGRGKDEDHESAGIGLSIVRDFVQLHHGRFWVEANSPSGAQFCISLPLNGATKR